MEGAPVTNDYGPPPPPPPTVGVPAAPVDTDLDSVRLANQRTLHDACVAAVPTLLASVAALTAVTDLPNATINANPAASIKDVAREVKTVARQTLRVARLMCGSFESVDVGDGL